MNEVTELYGAKIEWLSWDSPEINNTPREERTKSRHIKHRVRAAWTALRGRPVAFNLNVTPRGLVVGGGYVAVISCFDGTQVGKLLSKPE